MTRVQSRLKRVIDRLGDSFTVGGTAGKAVFSLLTPGQAGLFVGSAEASTLRTPLRLAYVAFDDSTSSGATLTLNGLLYTVRMVVPVAYRGQPIARMWLVVPNS